MSYENLLGGSILLGAATGLLVAFWSKVKAVMSRLMSMVIVTVSTEKGVCMVAVKDWLWRNCKRSKLGNRQYDAATWFVRPVGRRLSVAYEDVSRDTVVFWLGCWPIVVKFVDVTQGTSHLESKLTLTFIRGTIDPDKLIIQAMDAYNERTHGGTEKRFKVERCTGRAFRSRRNSLRGQDESPCDPGKPPGGQVTMEGANGRYLKYLASDLGEPHSRAPFEGLAFPEEVTTVVAEAERWRYSEPWYKEHLVPWRLGWRLDGLPGTGKTTLARAIAQTLDLPIIAPELSTYEDSEFLDLWDSRIMGYTPCMVLLEDIDTVFNKRVNIVHKEGDGLSFGCLLNCISGASGSAGIFLVVTTNKSENVDDALGAGTAMGRSTRPGRIDRVITLYALSEEARLAIAGRILNDCPEEIPAMVERGEGMTGAQFQDICAELALHRYWLRGVLRTKAS